VPFSANKPPPAGGPRQVAVIQFRPSSSELSGNDYAVLAQVAQIQRTNGATVRVVGHSAEDVTATSVEGLVRGNFEVSRRRALAVVNQLVQLGVPANRIVTEAASDEDPVYQTNTDRGIAANRRAEIFVDF
jgi:type VI secretion system protein ImpK